MRVLLGQINACVGDLDGNVSRVLEGIRRAYRVAADLAVFPELALTGYPPEDLLLNPRFIAVQRRALARVVAATRRTPGVLCAVGFVQECGGRLYNAAAIISDGAVRAVHRKIHLPNYGVFDEKRYFVSGSSHDLRVVVHRGVRIGFTICEDIWRDGDPVRALAVEGRAALIVNLSGSPYHLGKPREREAMLAGRAREYGCAVAFCNLVGGQDELVFDGTSAVIAPDGTVVARAPLFEESLLVADVDVSARARAGTGIRVPRRGVRVAGVHVPGGKRRIVAGCAPAGTSGAPEPFPGREEEVFRALVTGTRDYVRKNGFSQVVIGLSGGIDSSLVACVATEALGAANVTGVAMPSMFSSRGSVADARTLAGRLGIRFLVIPIAGVYRAFMHALRHEFAGTPFGLAEENLQSRVRGTLLMALSNKTGAMVLTTGNKSELSMGYATLYGDMAGGFAVIKDVYKTVVYRLAAYYNRWKGAEIIPQAVFDKPPSAELRPDQKDEDSLPPYAILDAVLKRSVEDEKPFDVISRETGARVELIRSITAVLNRSEYKRRQAPPGVKITPRAFGKDRRYPITSRF